MAARHGEPSAVAQRQFSLLTVSPSTRRLRIFVAHDSTLLTDHEAHGDGLLALNFLRSLAERGHELDVATQEVAIRGPIPPNLRLHRIMRGGELGPARRLRYAARVGWLYRRLAGERPYDLIHQYNPVDVGLTAFLPSAPAPLLLGPHPAPGLTRSSRDAASRGRPTRACGARCSGASSAAPRPCSCSCRPARRTCAPAAPASGSWSCRRGSTWRPSIPLGPASGRSGQACCSWAAWSGERASTRCSRPSRPSRACIPRPS